MAPTGKIHPSKRLILYGLGVLVICLVTGLVSWTERRAEARRRARIFTLPDGSGVELLGTGVCGAAFTTETRWQRLARRVLPARFQHWLPVVYDIGTNSSGDPDTLMVYLRFFPHSLFNFGVIGGFSSMSSREGDYGTEDHSGFCYPRYPAVFTVTHASSGAELYSIGVKAYPRRQQEFVLRWWDDKGALLATFNVPNPLRGPFPAWRPLPLPQTQSNGPVTLTLVGLREITHGSTRRLFPEFQLRAGDPGWANAKVTFQTLLDATGNESNPGLQARSAAFVEPPRDPTTNEIDLLSLHEPAWKLRALVDRKHSRDFAAFEKLVLTNLPLPAPGQYLAIDRSVERAGVAIKAVVLTGGGIFSVTNETARSMVPPDGLLKGRSVEAFWSENGPLRTWSSEASFMVIETHNTRPGDEIQIYAQDENGREVEVHSNGGREPTFVPPAGAKFLTVTIAISRPLSLDFLVNPADVRPPGKY